MSFLAQKNGPRWSGGRITEKDSLLMSLWNLDDSTKRS